MEPVRYIQRIVDRIILIVERWSGWCGKWRAIMNMSDLFRFSTASIFLATLSTLALNGAAEASVITPGPGASPPDVFGFTCPGAGCPTLLASTTSGWTNTTSTMSGTYEAAVYSDPTNTFGAGDLDFVYQVSNNAGSTDSIARLTATNFSGWDTDVGYATNGSALGSSFVDGTWAPHDVGRKRD